MVHYRKPALSLQDQLPDRIVQHQPGADERTIDVDKVVVAGRNLLRTATETVNNTAR
jgi:hypothetical protein